MTYAIPTPAEFLALTDPDEPEDEFVPGTPLESIADSLRRLVGVMEPRELISGEFVPGTVEEGAKVPGYAYDQLEQELADLEAKHGDVLKLIEEIRGIVKPSTSKVSLEVKAAIDRWAKPVVEPEPEAEGAKTSAETHGGYTSGPAVPSARVMLGGRTPAPSVEVIEQPAHDADTIEWRAYAKSLGRTDAELAMANRSMIRTMLGIEQPGGAS